ncbi:glucose dehydrogenase [Falsirhodobacter deserti]|uniref:glucose dehydrogenase n=1 Tax=Falsirhodobacter deserti TaxID=1365611 RepID=UPI000FE41AAD|nr:glucose dehydrogenase [Falsirhodobacter deserti]
MTFISNNATTPSGPTGRGWRFAAFALAIVLVLFGLPLVGGGIYLIILGGSWYYALAGLGLIVTAVELARQRMRALWIYLVVWGLTVIWAFWEVGFDWWGQVPRLVAPTVVLVLILIVLPALRRPQART